MIDASLKPHSPRSHGTGDFLRRHGPLGAIGLVTAVMLRLSWNRWADVLIDFGREVYIPWRISEGEVFYRDVVHLFGPFSSYLNALWFTLFGPHVRVLTSANLALAALLGLLLYRFFAALCDRLTATLLVLLFITGFALGSLGISGSANFICPYSHEATHGTLLGVAMLTALGASLTRPRPRLCAAAGLAWGATFLTKPDIFVAATGAALLYWGASLALARDDRRQRLGALAAFLLAAPLLPLGFLLHFLRAMPSGRALQALAGAWMPVLHSDIAGLDFYRQAMGLDFPAYRFAGMACCGVASVGLAVLAPALEARLAQRWQSRVVLRWAAGLACLAGGLLFIRDPGQRHAISRGLPGLTLAATLASLAMAVRYRRDGRLCARYLAFATFACYSCLMLLKAILNVGFSGNGFYLTLPATLTAAALIVGIIPQALRERGLGGGLIRAGAIGFVLAFVACFMEISAGNYRPLNYPIQADGDTLLTRGPESTIIGLTLGQGLDEVRRTMPPEATLLALPEGALINFLAKRRNPTPYNVFMPPEMMVFGAGRILESIQAHPPDAILLINRNTPLEYMFPPFGAAPDYGGAIMDWVRTHYRLQARYGFRPLVNGAEYGVELLRRKKNDF